MIKIKQGIPGILTRRMLSRGLLDRGGGLYPVDGYIQWLDLGVAASAFTTVLDRVGVLDAASIVAGELVQADAFFTSGTVSFYSADGASIDAKTFTQLNTHYNSVNGGEMLWVKVSDDALSAFAVQYALDKEWTPIEYLRNVAFFDGTPLIPFAVTPGTGIGPDGDWFTYDGTHILLVEDV